MLSAVAARKARLQQKAPPPQPPQEPEPSPPPSPASEDVFDHAKPPSKRKSSTPAAKSSRKKRKVNKPAEKKAARYFAEKDSFKGQEDVIVVEDDEDESESSSSGEEDGIPLPSKSSVPPKAQRRAWSPSAPLADSSDEDEDESALDEAVLNPVLPGRPVEEHPQLLSTLEQNFFDVTSEELQHLGFSSTSTTKLLILHPSDRLALLGTYSLTVLQGGHRLEWRSAQSILDCTSRFCPSFVTTTGDRVCCKLRTRRPCHITSASLRGSGYPIRYHHPIARAPHRCAGIRTRM